MKKLLQIQLLFPSLSSNIVKELDSLMNHYLKNYFELYQHDSSMAPFFPETYEFHTIHHILTSSLLENFIYKSLLHSLLSRSFFSISNHHDSFFFISHKLYEHLSMHIIQLYINYYMKYYFKSKVPLHISSQLLENQMEHQYQNIWNIHHTMTIDEKVYLLSKFTICKIQSLLFPYYFQFILMNKKSIYLEILHRKKFKSTEQPSKKILTLSI
jgi:hypothetical protein